MSETLAHVHITREGAALYEETPPHPPREETPEYRKAHHFLVVEQQRPCEVCSVTQDTLGDPARNPFGATALETHHYPIERSLMDACDPVKVHKAFPQVYDQRTLEVFVDSPANLRVLCDVHHRSVELGIHHLLSQDFAVLPFLRDGYQIVARKEDAPAVQAADERVIEQEESVSPSAAPASPPKSGLDTSVE